MHSPTNAVVKRYDSRNRYAMYDLYFAHIVAMAREKLSSRYDIAAELAWRDSRIKALENEIEAMNDFTANDELVRKKTPKEQLWLANRNNYDAPLSYIILADEDGAEDTFVFPLHLNFKYVAEALSLIRDKEFGNWKMVPRKLVSHGLFTWKISRGTIQFDGGLDDTDIKEG